MIKYFNSYHAHLVGGNTSEQAENGEEGKTASVFA